jgi:hypothetical protein
MHNIDGPSIIGYHAFCKSCDECQKIRNLTNTSMLSWSQHYHQIHSWNGVNFVGPIKLMAQYTNKIYILMTMNYTTKWVEVKALSTNMAIIITKLLYECILNNFKGPFTLVMDQGLRSPMTWLLIYWILFCYGVLHLQHATLW